MIFVSPLAISARVVIVVSFALSNYSAEAFVDTVSTLKDILIARSEQLGSFKGELHLTQTTHNGFTFEGERHYRQMGSNRYMEESMERSDPVKGKTTRNRTASMFNGRVSTCLHREDDTYDGQIGTKNSWVDPPGAMLSPNDLFGNILDRPLSETLQSGEFAVHEEHGSVTLTRFDYSAQSRTDWTVDAKKRLTMIQVIAIPSKAEIDAKVQAGTSLLSIGRPFRTYNYSDYVDVNGVSIPLKAELIVYDDAEDAVGAPEQKWELSGKDIHVNLTQTLLLSKDSLCINTPLSEEDFNLKFPNGTKVVDAVAGTSYVTGKEGEEINESLAARAQSLPAPATESVSTDYITHSEGASTTGSVASPYSSVASLRLIVVGICSILLLALVIVAAFVIVRRLRKS